MCRTLEEENRELKLELLRKSDMAESDTIEKYRAAIDKMREHTVTLREKLKGARGQDKDLEARLAEKENEISLLLNEKEML
jgi:hypothetical protein